MSLLWLVSWPWDVTAVACQLTMRCHCCSLSTDHQMSLLGLDQKKPLLQLQFVTWPFRWHHYSFSFLSWLADVILVAWIYNRATHVLYIGYHYCSLHSLADVPPQSWLKKTFSHNSPMDDSSTNVRCIRSHYSLPCAISYNHAITCSCEHNEWYYNILGGFIKPCISKPHTSPYNPK